MFQLLLLLCRCPKIVELDLRDNPLTDIEIIIRKLNLKKLGLNLNFPEIKSIKYLSTLEVLFFTHDPNKEIDILQEQNPNLKILYADFNIAWPDQKYNYQDGLWDVFGKCENIHFRGSESNLNQCFINQLLANSFGPRQ